MAEIKIHEESPLQPKRKPEAESVDFPSKSLKLDSAETAKEAQLEAAEEHAIEAEGVAKNSNGSVMADRKGKGILREDKGKGKMEVEEEEEDVDGEDDDDSDGDSSVGGSEMEDGGESDLSEDPLTEVDLENILPSRTRRKQVQPGVYIANDLGNDDDDSDDSDA